VPVYNSEGTLAELVARIEAVLRPVARYEIVLVNDGSRDRSATVIAELAAAHASVVGIDLMRNYGQHNALLAGIRAARHDVIVTIDDDLQNPPEEIPKLLDALAAGHDVVYGTPTALQHGVLRDLASQITKLTLQNAMGAETARKISAYRAFRRELRDAFATYQNPFVSIDVLLTWGTTRFTAVPVRHDPRRVGASNYTVGRLVIHAFNMMTGFTTWPLQLASLIGFGCTAFGLVLLAYILGRYVIEGGSVPGFPFLASAIAIFSGAQLFALGIIGEYVARIHFRTMDRPAYTIRRTITAEER
jgi:undecaprenyl-phosphate 4-deoxy-4-formamido-L-arabinose transferase